jgi:MtN3 and saliva related transmembrane protein
MNATVIEILGYTGSFLSAITFIPQVIQVYKTQNASGLSLQMLLIILSSTIVWLLYGFGINAWPVILCNIVIMVLTAWLVWFKLKTERK